MYKKRATKQTWVDVVAAAEEMAEVVPGAIAFAASLRQDLGDLETGLEDLIEVDMPRATWDLLCWVYGHTELIEHISIEEVVH